MTASTESAAPGHRHGDLVQLGRGVVLRSILVILVGGSQIGMLVIAAIYLQIGRVEDLVNPEAVLGMIAIVLALLVMRVQPRVRHKDSVFPWLLAFLVYGAISELLRPDLRLGNVTTLISIGAFYLMGRTIGAELIRDKGGKLPWTGALVCIYAFWYAGMLVFLLRGDLGFYGELPFSNLARLQFTEGFRATEIAIHVGFQVPVLVYVLLQVQSAGQRLLAMALLFCAFLLVLATASGAALAAIAMILVVFLFARIGMSVRTLILSCVAFVGIGIAIVTFFSEGIIESSQTKVEDISEGEGTRALIYAELIANMVTEPLGMGKGRFVETNTLSWTGKAVYPHQNFLGIGAELGVPAMVLFAGFVLTAFFVLMRRAWTPSQEIPRGLKMVAAVALAMFLYQQFRGLFQDTWTFRETYFWLGIAMGATSIARKPQAADAPAVS